MAKFDPSKVKLAEVSDYGSAEASQCGPYGADDGPVKVRCYRETTDWRSRKAAREFYMMGSLMCEGSESGRYLSIVQDLDAGKVLCEDGCP